MPSIMERTVAEGRGVRAERDLAEAASDFYLLELLSARGNADAARMLAKLEGRLAKEFACYLDMAIGGELRYAINRPTRTADTDSLLSVPESSTPDREGGSPHVNNLRGNYI